MVWKGHTFAAYNATKLPLVPARRDDVGPIEGGLALPREHDADYIWPGAYPRVAWASNKHPLMGFSPYNPSFRGVLLERLRTGTSVKRIAHDKFELDETTKMRWSCLEAILRHVIAFLLRSLPPDFGLYLWPIEASEPRLPSSFGFTGTRIQFKTENDARRAFTQARNAFLSLIATASGLVALHRFWERVRTGKPPTDEWARRLEQSGISGTYVQEILESEICTEVERVGVIVRIDSCLFMEKLWPFILQGLPVWFYLGTNRKHYPTDKFWSKVLLPSADEAEHYVAQRLAIEEASPEKASSSRTSPALDLDTFDSGEDNVHFDMDPTGLPMPSLTPLVETGFDRAPVPTPLALTNAIPPTVSSSSSWQCGTASQSPMPKPFPHSGQLPGETVQEFFCRRDDENALRRKAETPEQTMSRENHRAQVERQGSPGAKGPHVYEWVAVGGHYLRRRINRKDVDDRWTEYAPSQRRYDPFRRQWDLCIELDVHAKVPVLLDTDDEEDEGDELIGAYGRGIIPTRPGSNSPECGGQREGTGLVAGKADIVPPAVFVQDLLHADPLEKPALHLRLESSEVLARQRFGYSLSGEPVLGEGGRIDSAAAQVLWREAKFRMHMFDGVSDDALPSAEDHVGIRALIHELSELGKHGFNVGYIPAALSDMRTDNHRYVGNRLGKPLTIRVLRHYSYKIVQTAEDLANACYRREMSGLDVYTFCSRGMRTEFDPEWVLGVEDAVSTLQGIRSQSSDVYELVRYFVARGMPFSTLSSRPGRDDAQQLADELSATIDLGWRHISCKSGLEDYAAYERRFAAFLVDNPHARAVIMRGGLLWRLAVELLGIDDAAAMALTGPSPYRFKIVYETSPFPNPSQGPSTAWWDDSLTDAEENLLCGAHKLYRGMQRSSFLQRPCVADM